MTRTLNPNTVRRWMLALLLALGCFAAVPQARAQMTGIFNTDIVTIESALSAAQSAAGGKDVAAARVNMEELYRLWRLFRQKNIDGRPNDPQFAPNMMKAEQHLFAATQRIDKEDLPGARKELDAAQILLRGLRPQAAAK